MNIWLFFSLTSWRQGVRLPICSFASLPVPHMIKGMRKQSPHKYLVGSPISLRGLWRHCYEAAQQGVLCPLNRLEMTGVAFCGSVRMYVLGMVNSAWDSKSSSLACSGLPSPAWAEAGLLPRPVKDWKTGTMALICWSIKSSHTLNNSVEKKLYQITKILSFH